MKVVEQLVITQLSKDNSMWHWGGGRGVLVLVVGCWWLRLLGSAAGMKGGYCVGCWPCIGHDVQGVGQALWGVGHAL